jgi:hypothetical protein
VKPASQRRRLRGSSTLIERHHAWVYPGVNTAKVLLYRAAVPVSAATTFARWKADPVAFIGVSQRLQSWNDPRP